MSSQSPHCIALQLCLADTGEPIEWFQTRSQRGVNHVLKDLQALQLQAQLVSATALEDPDTEVIFPTSKWGNLSLAELRSRLGLAQVLQGNQMKKLIYSDRYLSHRQPSAAGILASLLEGDWLDEKTHLVIQIQQLKDEYDRRETHRRTAIEQTISHLNGKLKVEMRPYQQRHNPTFPHRRELTIALQNNQTYRILFDKGMDFLERNADGTYRITEETYVVIYQS